MLNEKCESLDAFKIFKVVVEIKLGKKIKCVNLNRGGEYYVRYDETRRILGPFAEYLENCRIKANYTMLRTLEQNRMAERRN